MRKIILVFIAMLFSVNIFSKTRDYNVYVDTSVEFVCYLENVVDESTKISMYFPATDSAIIIRDGNVMLKSNTLKLNEDITEKDILNLLNTDFYGSEAIIF